jgi:hypothetical protein
MVVGVGSKNIAGSFLEVIEKQGWQGLWAGNAINMLRIIPTQAIELGTFCWVLVWLVFGHMNGASHGIIANVYLINNCSLYLKERRKWCMYCT